MTTIEFPGLTRNDLPADRVLGRALDAGLETAVVIGFTPAGEFYLASSAADGGNIAWLLTRALHKLHQSADEFVRDASEFQDSPGDTGETAQVLPMVRDTRGTPIRDYVKFEPVGRADMCDHGYVRSTCSKC